MFSISWASSMETLGVKELSLVEAPEACRRVVSKMRGGYTLVKAATQTFPNGEVLVKDLVEDCDTRPMRGYRVWERMGSAALRRGAAALTEWLKG